MTMAMLKLPLWIKARCRSKQQPLLRCAELRQHVRNHHADRRFILTRNTGATSGLWSVQEGQICVYDRTDLPDTKSDADALGRAPHGSTLPVQFRRRNS